jgi:hypothetical protein
MSSSKVRAAAGAAVLVISALGELAQFVVAPAHISGGDAAAQVAAVGGQHDRMQLGLWLDVLILAVIPAMLVLGELAGARRSRLAATGTTIGFIGALFAGYLLANDVILAAASDAGGRPGALDVLSSYESSGVVLLATVAGVLGSTVGLVLLGIALVRARSVPTWAGVSVAAAPLLSIAGEAGGVEAVAVAAYALQLVAFAACAVARLRLDRANVLAAPVVTPVAS